ncbi:hypothetical protein PM082_024187 [Marasmius tenuissimus]|nr:hypothetical protein PM082_024187 [Marasmius tenuissimus]
MSHLTLCIADGPSESTVLDLRFVWISFLLMSHIRFLPNASGLPSRSYYSIYLESTCNPKEWSVMKPKPVLEDNTTLATQL